MSFCVIFPITAHYKNVYENIKHHYDTIEGKNVINNSLKIYELKFSYAMIQSLYSGYFYGNFTL